MSLPRLAEQGFAGDGEQRPLRSRSSPSLKPDVSVHKDDEFLYYVAYAR